MQALVTPTSACPDAGDYRDTVMNLNLCWKPVKDLTITPSLRVERETIANGITPA